MKIWIFLFFVVFFLVFHSLVVTHGQNTTQVVPTNTSADDHFVPMNIHQEPMTSLICEKRDKPYFIAHPSDTSRFYVCVKGQIFLLNCPSNYRFDSKTDQCMRYSNRKNSTQIDKPTKPTLIPHETNCGWYYVVRRENDNERILNSCPMPQLFDITTLECRNYTEVKCQDRFEPKDACMSVDLFDFQCPSY